MGFETTPVEQLSDEQLIREIAQDNHEAYYQLFERHWERMYSISKRLLSDEEHAKDVVQEIFLSLWEHRSSQEIQRVAAYLSRAAKFKSLNLLRDLPLMDGLSESSLEQPAEEGDPLSYQEMSEEVDRAILKLPDRCREVFLLSRKNQLSNREIADQLGLSQRTVETHISNALKQLRQALGAASILLFL